MHFPINISRTKLSHFAIKLVGKKNICILQSFLKVRDIKKKSILFGAKPEKIKENTQKKKVVFVVDGSTHHGGLSDRLRGLFSCYAYCKEKNIEFKVCWFYPFVLKDFFVPNNVDWLINADEMVYNKERVDVKFFNSYSHCNDDAETYFSLLDSKKPEVWVYSNVTLFEDKYKTYFDELFKVEERTQKALDENIRAIGEKYVSITFRFMNLLGDFQDNPAFTRKLTDEERDVYLAKCVEQINRIKLENTGVKRVLVTSDSNTFLTEAKKLPFVYTIPGKLAHMDESHDDSFLLHQKSFLDFLMLANAEKVYSFSYGCMFGATRFAKTAALIGGKEFVTCGR